MQSYFPLREKPALSPYKTGDLLVLFGELFTRGYANGLVEEAERRGMKVIYATVGRREKNETGQEILRPLTAEEIASKNQPCINIPLEAGFDLETCSAGATPVEMLKDVKLSEWQDLKLNFSHIEESRHKGELRFRKNTELFLNEVEKHITPGANVLFAHLMAGGVPRAKIIMPLMNRTFKGSGDRYLPSTEFWNSDIGKLCAISFSEVTAKTFQHLVELSQPLREKIKAAGGSTGYVAYGYHGTEVVIGGKYQWQCYSPYLQGWAKLELEKYAKEAFQRGISACVYNCPEILTNSSSIFQGVEVPLYNLLQAQKKEFPQSETTRKLFKECEEHLQQPEDLQKIFALIESFMADQDVKPHHIYEKWPQHSTKEQLGKLLKTSDEIIAFHKDEKKLMTGLLSEIIFNSCGYVMLHDSFKPKSPVAWINHDLCVRCNP